MKKHPISLTGAIVSLWFLGTDSLLAQGRAQWKNLCDGPSLTGWEQLNGTAKYTVENDCIVGTTVPGSPNSFLCTKKLYGNFILELESKVDEALNSGIQIRSQNLKELKEGRVHGYRAEIDPAQNELYSEIVRTCRHDACAERRHPLRSFAT